jgi:two-component system nitrogen regulation sensor histidine kinase NtrY
LSGEIKMEEKYPKPHVPKFRFVAAGIVIFFILFVIVKLFVEESYSVSPMLIKKPTIFFALWIVIILFTLTFLFVLIRNIIKLYYRDEESRAGRKIKSRLIFFFIAFSIIPTMLLFIFATDLIDKGINRWFSADIDSIMVKSKNLKTLYYEKIGEDIKHYANRITFDKEGIKEKAMYRLENFEYLTNHLKKSMRKFRLDVVSVYNERNELQTLFNPSLPRHEYNDLSRDIVYKGLSGSEFVIPPDSMTEGELIRAAVIFDSPKSERIMVVVGRYYPDRYIKNLKEIDEMVSRYNNLKLIRKPVKTTYILLFVFITILIIFSGSWIGLYLARGITRPISMLHAASDEIIKGNLDIEIHYKSKNELGSLIQKFNAMAKDLKENREKLKRSTDELRERRTLTETILNNITTGVIALDHDGRIIDVNPEAERMLSINKEHKLGNDYKSLALGDSTEALKNLIKKAFDTKFRQIEKELDIKMKGNIINLAVRITHIRDPLSNKFTGLIVVLTNLTELIRAQKMLVWKEVAKRIAHEIKNPLTPIQISSQRIMKGFDKPDQQFKKIVEDSLNIINAELVSIKELADEFSNFARLPKMKFTKGDINHLLEKIISVYSSIYESIEFEVNFEADIPILIKMDNEQLKRVFVNIIDNSIKAMEETGKIKIITRYMKETEFVRIEIADNGPGIPDDERGKIFVPYFSKSISGTGLGLAISHSIIEEHNGQISCINNQPSGVRFIIEIPA